MYEGMREEMEDIFKDEELFLSEHADHMTEAGRERGEMGGGQVGTVLEAILGLWISFEKT